MLYAVKCSHERPIFIKVNGSTQIQFLSLPASHLCLSLSLNRKAKTPHLEDNLVVIKDPKRTRVCL